MRLSLVVTRAGPSRRASKHEVKSLCARRRKSVGRDSRKGIPLGVLLLGFNARLWIQGLSMAWLLLGGLTVKAGPQDFFLIQVVDAATGRGVPLVELRTVNKAVWWTDSNGIVAFDEPGLMDGEVFFNVESPGYEYPKDAFGYRGLRLRPRHGGSTTIKLQRLNIAERLYRITGAGIYRDSVLVGRAVPLKKPVLNGQVMGQDTVIGTPYRGKIYWFWGDTDRASYPLGNFGASGATSQLPGHGELDPSVGVDLTYFVDDAGFSKPMCPLPKGGLHWIESLFTVPDEQGRERLLARMANVPGLAPATEWYLEAFNDDKEVFEPIQRWDVQTGHESAHPFRARVDGTNYFYIFSDLRVRADLGSLSDIKQYEAFTFVAGDGRWRGTGSDVDRDSFGRVRLSWKAGADRPRREFIGALVKADRLKPEEADSHVVDFETGATLGHLPDTVAWNEFRQRWIAFYADRAGGVCFAEADTPTGPWGYGRRIATHGEYNFYNIAHHVFFDQAGGRLAYFEGTYTSSFSDAREITPRYDYNQLMYRVALDDARLSLPVAVYRVRETNGVAHLMLRDRIRAARAWERIEEVACFALPPTYAGKDCVPVYAAEAGGTALSLTPIATGARLLFVGLPLAGGGDGGTDKGAEAAAPKDTSHPERRSPALVILREFRRTSNSGSEYSTQPQPPAGCVPDGRPICRVWRVPSPVLAVDWKAQMAPASGD